MQGLTLNHYHQHFMLVFLIKKFGEYLCKSCLHVKCCVKLRLHLIFVTASSQRTRSEHKCQRRLHRRCCRLKKRPNPVKIKCSYIKLTTLFTSKTLWRFSSSRFFTVIESTKKSSTRVISSYSKLPFIFQTLNIKWET